MDLMVLTLFLGFISAMLFIIPLLRKSDSGKSTQQKLTSQVYDVTSYVEEHPGGDAILAHAGDDSTEGFFGPQHATRVFDMIEDFYVGDLVK